MYLKLNSWLQENQIAFLNWAVAQTQNVQKRWINWRCGDGVCQTSSHLWAGGEGCKVKDGAVLICSGSELQIYSPGLADPGVEIMCPKTFVLRGPQGSPPGWRMTLGWWFGSILYINCITSTNENALRLHWVRVYTRKLNCESVRLGLVKIKYHNISHKQRHTKEILHQHSSGALQMPCFSWSAKSFLPPKEHPNAFNIDREIKKAPTTKCTAWILLLYWIAINMAAVGDVVGEEA